MLVEGVTADSKQTWFDTNGVRKDDELWEI